MRKIGLYVLFLTLSIGFSFAQTQYIKGTVIDTDGEPIGGAIINIKGDTNRVFTNIDGKFRIETNIGQPLVLNYLGIPTMEVNASQNIKIVIDYFHRTFSEVVVTGLTRTDKRLFTGATDQLNAEKIKINGISDISRMLEGQSAGVSVQNVSGTFGVAPKIRIRGATSILGNSKPLWVIDGIVIEDMAEINADALSSGDAMTLISSTTAGINPDDVESIQILKDGSATSIYGAKAKAGVIVITTKKGISGQSSINYTGEFTMRMKPSYRDFNILNSQDQMGIYKEMESKGWLTFTRLAKAANSGVYGKMYQLIDSFDENSIENTPEAKNRYLQAAEMRNTDWFDHLFNSNIMHNHSVGISSGNDKTTFYGSMSALSDQGWSKQSTVSRYTGNFNATHRILNNLSINLITNASYRNQNAPGTLSRTEDVVNGELKRDFDLNPYLFALNSSRTMDANTYYTRNYAPFNILNELDNNKINLEVFDLRFQSELKWKALPSLEISMLGALKYQTTMQEQRVTESSNQSMAYRVLVAENPFLYIDPDVDSHLPTTILPEGGFFRQTNYKLNGFDVRTSINYSKLINDKHIVNLFAASEINAINRNNSFFDGVGMNYGMGETAFYVYQYFKKGIEQNNSYYSIGTTRNRNIAYVSNANYSYQKRYVLSGTVRYEGSNGLGKSPSARWLPTWNVSWAWNVDEEKFFAPYTSIFSHLMAKASYSLVGDRGPATLTNSRIIMNSFSPFRPFTEDRELGIKIMNLENRELTYEKKHELNLGLSFGILKRKINIDFDWYTRNNFDLIGLINTQGVGGQIAKYANVANMKSHGIELTLATQNFKSRKFSWNTHFVFSNTRTNVTQLNTKPNVFDLVSGAGFTKVGYPHRALFSIPFKGLNSDGIPTFINQNGNTTSTEIFFQERDKIDFLKYEGPTEPPINGGLTNVLKYNNFTLNLFLTYSFGNVVRLDPRFQSSYSDFDSMPKEFNKRWVLPGDENKTNTPVIPSKWQTETIPNLIYAYNAYNYSDIRVAKGDFIRLKEVSFTYDIPKERLNTHLRNVSVKLQATNLFLLHADKKLNGQDPEFINTGGVALPMPRQFTFTLRLGL